MDKYILRIEMFNQKQIFIILKSLVLFTPLFMNKYVNKFRINQEMILNLFVLIAIVLWIIEILIKEKYIWYSNKINLSIFFIYFNNEYISCKK